MGEGIVVFSFIGGINSQTKANLMNGKTKEGASKRIQESPWRLHWGIFWEFDFIVCLTPTLPLPRQGGRGIGI